MDQLTGFIQATALQMLQNLFSPYGEIDEMNLEENAVKMMGLYKPVEPFSCLIDQLEKGRKFARAVGHIFLMQ